MRKYVVLFIVTLCSLSLLNAQSVLTGTVSDVRTGEPLVGAHVVVDSLNRGALTNEYGKFTIPNLAHGKYTVDISFVGYESVCKQIEIGIDKVAAYNFELPVSELVLANVVVSANYERPINAFSQVDINLRPTNSSQDMLRMIPGLFIAQHAGGGKAEQIFLRGFDIDHGTDINLEVDGLPVNMVSHAHGQGYSDLHFLIPELIHYVDFDKGPYYADKGDFTTAGYVSFFTKNKLDRNFIKAEGGQFGTVRTVIGSNVFSGKTNGYLVGEFFHSDGYFESPQYFNRFNVVSKINRQLTENDFLTGGLSFFKSRWDASGQVPRRAVEDGSISRFGSVDDTEGGETARANAYLKYSHTFSNGDFIEHHGYIIDYDFNLFSNFTFYLNDPVHGDQIHQRESRIIYGYNTRFSKTLSIKEMEARTEIGGGFRYDDVDDIALIQTEKRKYLSDRKKGDVNEANFYTYINEKLQLNDYWAVYAGIRFDHFYFRYNDKLLPTRKSNEASVVSPKLSLNFQMNERARFYLNSGIGFHSNDARVVVEQSGHDFLPKAYGIDLGTEMKVTDRLLIHAALWHLDLDQEFVYIGDEGIVEPSGKTKRKGIDLSVRYQLQPWLFFDGDINWSHPRSKDDPEGENYIPLAPVLSSVGGITFRNKKGLNGSLRYRYIDDRPANEDYSVVAKGYFLLDAVLNYTQPGYELGFSIQNLFNERWNEAQFDTTSMLKNETEPVSEIHFTPGSPLFIKFQATFFF